ncbi:MAG TPA: hypothetical protein VLI54_02995 [Bacillota bacterium]|nr:hypothetical protein [Bacillota bacterium]
MKKHQSNKGFSAVEAIVIVLVVAVIGVGGWYVWHKTQNKPAKTSSSSSQANNSKNSQQTDPYEGWKAYSDTASAAGSGIAVKYPSDWTVVVGDSKAFAWEIRHDASPKASVNVRYVYIDSSKTPQQEWEECPSADACGPSSDDTKLEGAATSINGLSGYSVKMQNNVGVYYATIIKGSKQTSKGTVFVEFLISNPDSSALDTYRKIVASANFSD